ncbi:uncharacterized protein GGS22DRAFT_169788 [Annulohypoxylon maeteangense]|uniref:uncharacterized protein n=1 Tax=Annulohypoxylon maeteangense TaxID=1927788 RepID=UPI002007810D|nr:uncharacterized protein GGS22DRAFT_169788 [Annulohypoxylon maeteangense]KAI0882579.1 hypothetical protein GGS22DRAFT_169788 [Annulohypoxylon maeteangense]
MINDHSSKLNEITRLVNKVPDQAEMVLEKHNIPILLDSIFHELQAISASSTRQFIIEHGIVRSLYFGSRLARHESIQDAHKDTFKWVLRLRHRSRSSSDPPSTIISWLKSGSGIYWVSGKPGSGKSTFMKFVADHPETQIMLDKWAISGEPTEYVRQNGCITACFYFWSAGTHLQKSTEGLLRSLLFEILSRDPDLIPIVFPELWASSKMNRTVRVRSQRNLGMQHDDELHRDWTIKDLSAALRLLSTAPTCSSRRFCFFIDGLDEYHGDHRELANMLLIMSTNRNIKLCVSSRPWNVFEDTLGQDASQKLYIHELTEGDIRNYTISTLHNDRNWVREVNREPRYNAMIKKITDKAHGVFLWVFLVVRSLQEGLSNGDSLFTLDRRIQDMPEELGPFFRHMLSSVPSIYHVQMALYFLFTLNSPFTIMLMHFSFIDDYFENESLPFDIPQASIYNRNDIDQRFEQAKRRLNARCKGLLEVHASKDRNEELHLVSQKVTFLHRTVRDFLQTDEMWHFLKELVGEIQVNRVIFGSLVALFKSLPLLCPNPNKFELLSLSQALYFARGAEKEAERTTIQLLDELRYDATGKPSNGKWDYTQKFYYNVVSNGLCKYVYYLIDRSIYDWDPMEIALRCAFSNDLESPDMYDMVAMLLDFTPALSDKQWTVSIRGISQIEWDKVDIDIAERYKRILSLILPYVKDMKGWGVILPGFFSDYIYIRSRSVANARAQMIGELLTYEANPNDPHDGETCWTSLCSYLRNTCPEGSNRGDNIHLEFVSDITELLLKAGADTSCDGSLTIDEVQSRFPTSLAKPICDLLREKAADVHQPETLEPPETSISFNSKYFGFLLGAFRKHPST